MSKNPEQEVLDRIKQLYIEEYNAEIDDEIAEEVWTIFQRLIKDGKWI